MVTCPALIKFNIFYYYYIGQFKFLYCQLVIIMTTQQSSGRFNIDNSNDSQMIRQSNKTSQRQYTFGGSSNGIPSNIVVNTLIQIIPPPPQQINNQISFGPPLATKPARIYIIINQQTMSSLLCALAKVRLKIFLALSIFHLTLPIFSHSQRAK